MQVEIPDSLAEQLVALLTHKKESKFTIDDVRTRLKKLDPGKAREMLKRFDVERLSQVDPAQYEDMISILDQEGA